jgi:hypothetical protein
MIQMMKRFMAGVILLAFFGPLVAAFAEEQADLSSVVLIPPQGEPDLQQRTAPLTEEEVCELVWNLPEVQREANRILTQGGAPSASVGFRPRSENDPEASRLFYTVHFEAGQVDKPSILPVFVVDALTAEILVYDSSSGKLVTLDTWREQRNRSRQSR